jgi:hypothetical protein
MSRFNNTLYTLIGKLPVPCEDSVKWAEWCAKTPKDDCRVALTVVGGIMEVSTVFLGMNHNMFGDEPLLFESMIFSNDPRCEDINENCRRCSTWTQAENMHVSVVAEAEECLKAMKLTDDWLSRASRK